MTGMAEGLPILSVLLPAVIAVAMLAPPLRRIGRTVAPWAALPALFAALAGPADEPAVLSDILLGTRIGLDDFSATLLGLTAALWTLAGAYARTYMRDDPHRDRFFAYWAATLSGNLWAILAFDAASFYAAFSVVTFAAYGLIVHEGTVAAARAGRIYIVLAVVGEAAILAGFMLASAGAESLAAGEVAAAGIQESWRHAWIALFVVGFGIKCGLLPLHVWLPLAHPAAPTPASAVLSGAIIKVGVLGLVRFLPLGAGPAPWGDGLIGLGLLTAAYGIVVGLFQRNPKTILAYSSLSQMGLVVCGIGVALASAEAAAAMLPALAIYLVQHGFAKGALFLGVGVVAGTPERKRRLLMGVQAVAALSIAGAPLTGGAVAKLALKEAVDDGTVATLVGLSAIGTAALMVHFLHVLRGVGATAEHPAGPGLRLPWALAVAAALIATWVLFLMGRWSAERMFDAPHLWAALWPVVLGGGVALGLSRSRRAASWSLPEGDVVALVRPVRRIFGLTWPATYGPPHGRRFLQFVWAALDEVTGTEIRLRRWRMLGIGYLCVLIGLLAAIFATP